MSDCCNNDPGLNALHARQRSTLWNVLAINAVMFIVLIGASMYANSTALLSDSLDNLGDTLTYAISLYAVSRGSQIKARVALFKGLLILTASLFVAGHIIFRVFYPAVPIFEAIGAFSLISLVANGICLGLLWRHRKEDINMSSVWECSRNDITSNLAVFVAAVSIWATGSRWPDIIVAAALTAFFMRSGCRIISAASAQMHAVT